MLSRVDSNESEKRTDVGIEAMHDETRLDQVDTRDELISLDTVLVQIVGSSTAGDR